VPHLLGGPRKVRNGDRTAVLSLIPPQMYQGMVEVIEEMPDVPAVAAEARVRVEDAMISKFRNNKWSLIVD
jgi:hypothetical protein